MIEGKTLGSGTFGKVKYLEFEIANINCKDSVVTSISSNGT